MVAPPGLHYVVELARPEDHLAGITMTVPVPAGADAIEVTLPAWCPGSYLIRDYARFIRGLGASDRDGSPRKASKIDKSTWRIEAAGATEIDVRYQVYGHDLTVRTNHIDGTHAFLHGPATFLYTEAQRTAPVVVDVIPPAGRGWQLTTGMTQTPDEAGEKIRLTAASIDELFDMPIHAGVVDVRRFTAADHSFELAIWGEPVPGGVFTVDDLVRDLGKIATDHAHRVGEVPFQRYAFVLMLAHDSYGGLEHRNSSINLYNPLAFSTRKQYEGLLELLSHEHFHVWNGKRIAPAVLLDFDYRREAYTRCLWVMEGLTSHYDRWALRSSTVIQTKSYLDKVLDDWTRLLAIPGRKLMSLEDSSFDAWIKLYKPDESNLNTTVSYYLKGGLVMFALDLAIRRRTEGARSLDDVLRLLWREFGAKGIGHPEDVKPVFEEATGLDLGEVFARQIRGTEDPDIAGELAHVGLELKTTWDPAQIADGAKPVWLGAMVSSGARITGVVDDGPGRAGGLSPGDELIAIDRVKTTSESDARTVLATRKPGDHVELAVFRRNRLTRLEVILAESPPTKWEIAGIVQPGPEAERYKAWLNEPHPSGQSVCVVTTATRAL